MAKKDTIVASVLAKYKSRAKKGLVKYNKTMDRNDLDLQQWLTHLQEELMDATLYVEKIKQEVEYQEYELIINRPHLEFADGHPFGPCSMHDEDSTLNIERERQNQEEEVSEQAIMEALEDHPKHFDQPFPDDWDEFLEEELEGSIAADLEEIRREERMKIIGQNGNDGLHYGTEEDGTGYVDYPENRTRTIYPGDAWVATHTGPRPCGWDNTKKDGKV